MKTKARIYFLKVQEADPVLSAEKVRKYINMKRDADPVVFHNKANSYARKYTQRKRELKIKASLVE